jgi:cell division protein FtsZ
MEMLTKPVIEKPKMPVIEPKINAEPPAPKEEPLPNRIVFNLENSFDIIEEQPQFNQVRETEFPSQAEKELEYKKNLLNEQARDRVSKLRSLSSNFTSRADDFKERLDTPAYLRKKVVLQNVQASNENNMSRYNLNDDNQILGNNRFLHDNVD